MQLLLGGLIVYLKRVEIWAEIRSFLMSAAYNFHREGKKVMINKIISAS
jgi:hypothetical protein